MSADETWAQATNKRAGIPYERDVIAELDAENARLHGELIDVQCELATARAHARKAEASAGAAGAFVEAVDHTRRLGMSPMLGPVLQQFMDLRAAVEERSGKR